MNDTTKFPDLTIEPDCANADEGGRPCSMRMAGAAALDARRTKRGSGRQG